MRKSGGYKGPPCIQLQMTDKDTVAKAAELMGGKLYGPHGPYGASKLVTYQTSVYGSTAIGWMMTLYQLMGARRRAKIEEVIGIWKGQQTVLPTRKPSCHPARDYFAKGMCNVCYMKDYHSKRTNAHSPA